MPEPNASLEHYEQIFWEMCLAKMLPTIVEQLGETLFMPPECEWFGRDQAVYFLCEGGSLWEVRPTLKTGDHAWIPFLARLSLINSKYLGPIEMASINPKTMPQTVFELTTFAYQMFKFPRWLSDYMHAWNSKKPMLIEPPPLSLNVWRGGADDPFECNYAWTTDAWRAYETFQVIKDRRHTPDRKVRVWKTAQESGSSCHDEDICFWK